MIIYGILVWLIPFVISFFIYPLKQEENPLFESIMPVVVALATVIFAVLYLKKIGTSYMKETTMIGIAWFLINVVLDLLMFMWGPMKMGFAEYWYDIGVTYLMIPIITIGLGTVMDKVKKKEI